MASILGPFRFWGYQLTQPPGASGKPVSARRRGILGAAWKRAAGSPTLYVVAKNLHRRHLDVGQRAAIGVELVPLLQAEAKKRLATSTGGAHPRPVVNVPQAVKGKTREIAAQAVQDRRHAAAGRVPEGGAES
jgi:hypothetical protein